MCQDDCFAKTPSLTLPGGATSGLTIQNFQFANDSGTDYSKLELRIAGQLECCHNIGENPLGIRVESGQLVFSEALDDRFVTIDFPTDTNRDPELQVYKDGNNYFLIGIDDIRENFSVCYFKFKLNGSNNGVNVGFKDNSLVIEGGHTL